MQPLQIIQYPHNCTSCSSSMTELWFWENIQPYKSIESSHPDHKTNAHLIAAQEFSKIIACWTEFSTITIWFDCSIFYHASESFPRAILASYRIKILLFLSLWIDVIITYTAIHLQECCFIAMNSYWSFWLIGELIFNFSWCWCYAIIVPYVNLRETGKHCELWLMGTAGL